MGVNWEYKIIRDPIYGFVAVPDILLGVVEHPLFQRLRWISQTATGQMIYPGSTHTRFEHSLGVMHLAKIAAESMWRFAEKNEKELTPFWDDACKGGHDGFVLAAMLVGLLHDVGHAPFSHVYEMAVDYDHEIVGYKIAERILQDAGLSEEQFSKWALEALNKPPQGKSTEALSPVPQVLRALVDGPVDIDKGDYLLRDSYHCGVAYGNYGHLRLWKNVGVVQKDDGTFAIGVKEKAIYEAYHMLIARKHMYYAVYEHHTRRKADALLSQILSGSKSTTELMLKFLESEPLNPENLLLWNNGQILSSVIHAVSPDPGTKKQIEYLKALVHRLYRREFPTLQSTTLMHAPTAKESYTEQRRAIRKVINKSSERGIPLFIYYRRASEHLPMEATKVLIVSSKKYKNLASFLRMEDMLMAMEIKEYLESEENVKREVALEIYTYPEEYKNKRGEVNALLEELKDELRQAGVSYIKEAGKDEQG